MHRYEQVPENKRPFAAVANQEHISDDDEEDIHRVDDHLEPAHPGSSHKGSELDRFGGKQPADDYHVYNPLAQYQHMQHPSHSAATPQLLTAGRRDEGAHVAPAAQQEMEHDHAEFDDTVGYHNNHHPDHRHAFHRE